MFLALEEATEEEPHLSSVFVFGLRGSDGGGTTFE